MEMKKAQGRCLCAFSLCLDAASYAVDLLLDAAIVALHRSDAFQTLHGDPPLVPELVIYGCGRHNVKLPLAEIERPCLLPVLFGKEAEHIDVGAASKVWGWTAAYIAVAALVLPDVARIRFGNGECGL